MGFSLNLPFACIIVFSTLLSVYEATLAALIFMSFVFLLSYDSQIIWAYPLIAIISSKFNPEDIEDKFLVSIVFALIFSPIIELFNPHGSDYISKLLYSSLSAVITIIPVFFMTKFFFKHKSKSFFNRT
jgi:hypothetical protein